MFKYLPNLSRRISFYIKGYLVGLAELIPGISGGTIALVTGIYPLLLSVLSQCNYQFVKNFFLNFKETSEKFRLFDFFSIIIGMFVALLTASSLMHYLYTFYQDFLFAFIFGLLLVSFLSLSYRNIRFRQPLKCMKDLSFLFIGSVVAFTFFIFLDTLDVAIDNVWLLGLAGFFAVLFFLLPGISGSSFLLMIGLYDRYLSAWSELMFSELIYFFVGAALGFLVWSKVVYYFLEFHRNITMLIMVGLLSSVLVRLNPFQEIAHSDVSMPYLSLCVVLGMLIGSLLAYWEFLWED